jgi:hypothetical protein
LAALLNLGGMNAPVVRAPVMTQSVRGLVVAAERTAAPKGIETGWATVETDQ